MLVAIADGLDHLAIVPVVYGVGVGEQQHQIDLIVGDAGIDLLVTALLMGKEQRNGQTGIIRDQPSGGGSCVKVMLAQHTLVSGAKLDHQLFFLVVG